MAMRNRQWEKAIPFWDKIDFSGFTNTEIFIYSTAVYQQHRHSGKRSQYNRLIPLFCWVKFLQLENYNNNNSNFSNIIIKNFPWSYLKSKKLIKKLLNPSHIILLTFYNKEWISVIRFLIKIEITLTSSHNSSPVHRLIKISKRSIIPANFAFLRQTLKLCICKMCNIS